MNRILALREKAKEDKRSIVLPEGNDKRVIKAAAFIENENIANICILGNEDNIKKIALEESLSIDGLKIIDPEKDEKQKEIISSFYERRKHKGITPEEAAEIVLGNTVYYGAMMTNLGLVDGFVAGASNTTSNVARAAIHCLDLNKEIGTISSSFIIELDKDRFGEEGLFAFGDCGIVPFPSPKQLAGIAVSTSDLFRTLFSYEPHVALLSYSTKGSAKGDSIDAIREALDKIKEKRPDLIVDGELQLDAAIVPEVAKVKCPESEVGGNANVLIFPNLAAGNISYKMIQRLGNAKAVGPVIQGLHRPCSDLSRGCGWEDIVDAVTVISIQAQSLAIKLSSGSIS